jgi:hypothetical protein
MSLTSNAAVRSASVEGKLTAEAGDDGEGVATEEAMESDAEGGGVDGVVWAEAARRESSTTEEGGGTEVAAGEEGDESEELKREIDRDEARERRMGEDREGRDGVVWQRRDCADRIEEKEDEGKKGRPKAKRSERARKRCDIEGDELTEKWRDEDLEEPAAKTPDALAL